MGKHRDALNESAATTAAAKAADEISFKARAYGTKVHDDWDAYMTQAIRKAGGGSRAQERRIAKFLKRRGH